MSLKDVENLLIESKKAKISMQNIEDLAYPDLALFCKILLDKIGGMGYELDIDDKIDIMVKFFRYTAQKPSKLRYNIRRLIGAKPRALAHDLFVSLGKD